MKKLLRLLILFALLYAGFFGLHELAASSIEIPGLRLVIQVPYRCSEIMALPFKVMAAIVIPARHHHYGLGHLVLRFALAGAFWAMAVEAVVSFLRVFRPRPPARIEGLPVDEPESPARRQAIARSVVAAGALVGGGAMAYVTWITPARFAIRRNEVAVPELPAALDGLRLAHLTDTHCGPYISPGHILRAIELANAEEPDLFVLTGDYVHRTAAAIPAGIGLFAELRSRLGTLAVLGNHDHWEDADACRRWFADIDVPLIDNDRLFVTEDGLSRTEAAGRSLAIVGVGDYWEDRSAPRLASRDIGASCPRILLSHNPDVAEHFARRHNQLHFDLQLSGHTHGGQVAFPGIGTPVVPSEFGSRYARGFVQGPHWPVIVSTGVGMAVAPLRFRVLPEIGVITLRRA